MLRISIILSILFSSALAFSQSDSLEFDEKAKDRFVIGFVPSPAKNIYGIAIGPIGSEAICNRPYTKYSHGLNLQVPGQGFFQTFYIGKKHKEFRELGKFDSLSPRDILPKTPKNAVHNGILVSPLGTFTSQVNGISFSSWMSMGQKINGVSFNLLWNSYMQINGMSIGLVNHAALTNGVQIGLVNKTKRLKGFQFGLWNKNDKRSLPIMNWGFKNEKSTVAGSGKHRNGKTKPSKH